MKRVLLSALILPVLSVFFFAFPAVAQDQPYALPGTGTNYETRLSDVEDQLRVLTGKVEQLDYTLRRLDSGLQRLQTDYEARLNKLETAPPAVATIVQPAQAPAPQAAQPGPSSQAAPSVAVPDAGLVQTPGTGGEPANPETSVRGTLGALKVQGEKVTGAVKSPKAPALPETPEDYGLTAQEQYDKAFSLLRQANYEGAEKAFKSFIDKNPKDKLIDNAKYWYAETFYVRTKFSEAAVAFGAAFEQNPKGVKAPDSLLKLGLSLSQLDNKEDACTTLGELKNKYPNAPSTIRMRAEQERMRLKCGNKKP